MTSRMMISGVDAANFVEGFGRHHAHLRHRHAAHHAPRH
jgi:hypothetical protein